MRLAVVVVMTVGFVMGRGLHRRWRRGLARPHRPLPTVPAALLAGARRTWVVFTTPYCAACRPVTEQLRGHDPEARVVTVDATREPQLAGAFGVRAAPTVLLADASGRVQARLVGGPAVADHLAGRPPAEGAERRSA